MSESETNAIQMAGSGNARGGNTLFNLGPRGDGSINPQDRAIFEGIGAWWWVNAESIRGTTRTPLPVQAWGESTRRGNRLYLHVFKWPTDGQLLVGGLLSPIAKAWLLAAPDRALPVAGNRITVPPEAPDPTDSIVVVECAEEPRTEPARLGAGGTFSVQIANTVLTGEVRPGLQTVENLGQVVIPAGVHTTRVQAREITGEELFRLRHVRLLLRP